MHGNVLGVINRLALWPLLLGVKNNLYVRVADN